MSGGADGLHDALHRRATGRSNQKVDPTPTVDSTWMSLPSAA